MIWGPQQAQAEIDKYFKAKQQFLKNLNNSDIFGFFFIIDKHEILF